MHTGIDFAYIVKTIPKLLQTLPFTLWVILVSGVLGFLLGLAVTAVRVKKPKIAYGITAVYVSYMRSTPGIIQLFVVYYGLPILLSLIGIDINQWTRTTFAVLSLVLHNGTYVSEVLRPAYLSIDKGQHDAADSICLSGTQKLFHIIAPQMLPVALPSLGNLLIDLIKDTSLLFTIGVVDLMGKGKIIIGGDYGVGQLEVYISIALLYWAISAISERGMHGLEKKRKRHMVGLRPADNPEGRTERV